MKRFWSVIAAGALVSSAFTVGSAQAAPEIPATVQVDDPKGDANAINDQDNAYGTPLAGQGDHNQATVGNATDLLKIWFSNTDADVSLHFQTNGDPNRLVYDSYFRFSSNPGEGAVGADKTRGCLQWVASLNGAAGAYTGATEGVLTDKCNVGTPVVGTLVSEEGPDKTFITTITFPRSYSPLLADGGSITTPFGVSRIVYYGPTPQSGAFVTLDNTKRGTDYAISGGAPTAPPVVQEPPVDKPDPKGCTKGKGKKKGCGTDKGKGPKGPKAPQSCAPLAAGPMGAGAETFTVTDAATAEAPLEVPVKLDMSLADLDFEGVLPAPFDPTQQIVNIQVDPAAAEAGLYLTFEFPQRRDYDLFLRHNDDSEAASAHGFNTAIETPFHNTKTNHAGESTSTSEKIIGLRTTDCGGYTLEVNNWLGEGGNMVVKAFLGEIKNDPRPVGEVPLEK